MSPERLVEREMIRHLLATVAYRATRATENLPEDFGAHLVRPGSRTPVQILAHIGDLFDWALSLARGAQVWQNSTPLSWEAERSRCFASLKAFDDFLAGTETVACPSARLIQGPIADALTHVGQVAMLRRMAGYPARGENFFVADIEAGQVGPDQPAPRRTFA